MFFSAVNFICDHPDIKAISFVGSDQAVSSYSKCISSYSRHILPLNL